MTWNQYLEPSKVTPRRLECINISEAELQYGIDMAAKSRLKINFQIMDAHHLEFPEASFDFVYGGGILHHIDFETGLKEVRRMMKPDAIALFMEPLDNNPVGQIVRRLTPSARTPDETPLRHEHLALVKKYFDAKFYFEQMTSVPLGIASSLLFKEQDNSLTRLGMNLDEALLRNFSGIGPYFRFLTMILQKPKA